MKWIPKDKIPYLAPGEYFIQWENNLRSPYCVRTVVTLVKAEPIYEGIKWTCTFNGSINFIYDKDYARIIPKEYIPDSAGGLGVSWKLRYLI